MNAAAPRAEPRPLKGIHVLAMFVLGFGIIIAVNLTLAFNAVATFPGIETKNSYVASQRFQAARDAQEALGWRVGMEAEGGRIVIAFEGPDGPVLPAEVDARVGRATFAGQDLVLDLTREGGAFAAPAALVPGAWVVHLSAVAEDGTVFRKRLDLRVRP